MGDLALILTIVGTIITSTLSAGGFWAFLEKRSSRQNSSTTLLLGLAHMKIVEMGLRFIKRGYITKAEYQDFLVYLVEPYEAFGGNGLADQVYQQVKQLPIQHTHGPNEETDTK